MFSSLALGILSRVRGSLLLFMAIPLITIIALAAVAKIVATFILCLIIVRIFIWATEPRKAH